MYKTMLTGQQDLKLKQIQKIQEGFDRELQQIIAEREQEENTTKTFKSETMKQIDSLVEKVKILEQQLESAHS
jgi:uncharacterized protein YicC (UPF0701 family)